MDGTGDVGNAPDESSSAEGRARAASRDVLHPAIPQAAAAIIAATDPRLNRPSETEEELKELVESNAADEEYQREQAAKAKP